MGGGRTGEPRGSVVEGAVEGRGGVGGGDGGGGLSRVRFGEELVGGGG